MIRRSARALVLDESLNPRLASELAARGRHAVTVRALGLGGAGDLFLLDALDDHHLGSGTFSEPLRLRLTE